MAGKKISDPVLEVSDLSGSPIRKKERQRGVPFGLPPKTNKRCTEPQKRETLAHGRG